MNILYVGAASGTSLKRYQALQENGHRALIIDPRDALPVPRQLTRWSYKTGALGLSGIVSRFILKRSRALGGAELAIIDNGEMISGALVDELRHRGMAVVLLNLDNPFSPRDGYRFRLVRKSIDRYDAFFTPRRATAEVALRQGVPRAFAFWQAADDALLDDEAHIADRATSPFKSTVSFTGTWMEDRDALIAAILDAGIDIKVNGPGWEKAPRYGRIRNAVRLGSLDQDRFYEAIAASDISIGLVSAGNGDRHTTRSMEIPALRSLLVAQRTEDHMALYQDGREAFFWDDVGECIAILRKLLADPPLVASARQRGYERARANNNFNRPLMAAVVAAARGEVPDDAQSRVRSVILAV